jgi:hypothetical protein
VLVGQIRDFLVPPEGGAELGTAGDDGPTHEEQLRAAGFDEVTLARTLRLADAILARQEWRERTEAALRTDDDGSDADAVNAAKRLGIPIQAYLVERIERRPNESYPWYELVAGADEERMDEAIALAERLLDLDAVATGPGLELFGPPEEEGPHQAVGFVLQELERFPGRGESLLLPALRSPVIRHRLTAVRALGRWGRVRLTEELVAALTETARSDPDEDVRRAAEDVLAGRPVD